MIGVLAEARRRRSYRHASRRQNSRIGPAGTRSASSRHSAARSLSAKISNSPAMRPSSRTLASRFGVQSSLEPHCTQRRPNDQQTESHPGDIDVEAHRTTSCLDGGMVPAGALSHREPAAACPNLNHRGAQSHNDYGHWAILRGGPSTSETNTPHTLPSKNGVGSLPAKKGASCHDADRRPQCLPK